MLFRPRSYKEQDIYEQSLANIEIVTYVYSYLEGQMSIMNRYDIINKLEHTRYCRDILQIKAIIN